MSTKLSAVKLWLISLLLFATATSQHAGAEAVRFPFDTIIEISGHVENGHMTEEMALGFMSQTIEHAKKQVAEHKPANAAEMARVLEIESLSSETWGAVLNDNPKHYERVAMTRNRNTVTVTLGQKGQNGSRTFSLEGTGEADQTFKTLFAAWRAYLVKVATAPSEDSEIAKATPQELLARGRAIVRGGGASSRYMRTTLKLHDEDLVIERKDGFAMQELISWHDAVTKLVATPLQSE